MMKGNLNDMCIRVLNLIPQYPMGITQKEIKRTLGLKGTDINCYLYALTNNFMVCEDEGLISRCDEYYGRD